MAKNTTIKVKGEFDASQMLQSLQEVRKNLQSLGIPTREFERFDKQFEKANLLASQLSAQMQTGFSNTKQIDNFERSYGRLDVMLTQLRNTLSTLGDNVDISIDSTQLNKLKTNLQNLENARSNMLAAAKEEIINNKKNLNLNQNQVKSLQEQVENAENLKQLLKDIGRERYAKLANKVSDLDTEAMNISIGANTNIHKSALKNITDGGDEQLIGKAYQTALTETVGVLGSGEMALNTFVRELLNYNITLKDSEEALRMLNADIDDAISSGVSSPSQKGTINMMRNRAQAIGMPMDNGDFLLGGGAASIVSNASNLENNAISITNTQNAISSLSAADALLATEAMNELALSIQNAELNHASLSSAVVDTTENLRQETESTLLLHNSFNKMKDAIKTVLSISGAWRMVSKVAKETFLDISKIDEAFAKIAMVTSKSVAEMWSSYNSYADMAKRLGQNTADAIKASALFYQQGLDTKEALNLTEDTMKLATLSGQDFQKATEQMTAALRGFHMEMEAGSHITDVYSELAANAAADVHGIAYAMSKTASIANSAGMSFENTSAFLTQMIETTQEAPENIGTAMKTIIARFTELKDNVAGTVDSEFSDLDYNKVDKALKSVGVALKDNVGQFRNLDDVFLELSEKWNTLDRNSQRYIATIAAGSRQQSRFIAMMENYKRTMELVEVAQDSAGRSEEQFAKYLDTVEYKINKLKTTWEELRVNLMNSDEFKKIIDIFSLFVEKFSNIKLSDLATIGLLGLTVGKLFITNFIQQVQSSTQQLQKVGEVISTAITQKLNTAVSNALERSANRRFNPLKIPTLLEVDNASVLYNNISRKIKQLLAASPLGLDIVLTTNINALDLLNLANFNERMEAMGLNANEARNALLELANSEAQLNGTTLLMIQEMGQASNVMERQRGAIKGVQEGLNSVGMAATTFVTTLIATKDVETSFKALGASLAMTAAQMAVQYAAMAVSAKVGGRATGLAFGTGVNEGLASTGVGAIIVAIASAIALVSAGIYALAKKYQNSHKSIQQLIEEINVKIEEAEKHLQELKSLAKESNEAYNNKEKLRQEYEELSRLTIRTTEQEEKYKNLTLEIVNLFPEIVTYYNEITGELQILNEIWDEILKKQKEQAQKDTRAYLTLQLYTNQLDLNKSELSNRNQRTIFTGMDRQQRENITQSNNLNAMAEISKGFLPIALYDTITKKLGYSSLLDTVSMTGNAKGELSSFAEYLGLDVNNAEDFNTLRNVVNKLNGSTEKLNEEEEKYYEQLVLLQSKGLEYISGLNKSLKELQEKISEENLSSIREYLNSTLGSFLLNDEIAKNINEQVEKEIENMEIDYSKIDDYISKGYIDLDKYDGNSYQEKRTAFINSLDFYDTYDSAARAALIEELTSQMFTDFTQELIEETNKILENYSDKTLEQLDNLNFDEQSLPENFRSSYNAYVNKLKEEIGKSLDEVSVFSPELRKAILGFTKDLIDTIYNSIQEVNSDKGQYLAVRYANTLANITDRYNLSGELLGQLINEQSWGQATAYNWERLKQNIIDNLTENGIQSAEKLVEEMIPIMSEAGKIDIVINNLAELDEFSEKMDEIRDKAFSEKDTFISSITKQVTEGKVALEDYEKLQKSLKEINLDVDDYVSIDSNGSMILDTEALRKAYIDTMKAKEEELEYQLLCQEAEMTTLKIEIARLKTLKSISQEASTDIINNLINHNNMTVQEAEAYVNEHYGVSQEYISGLEDLLNTLEDTHVKTQEELIKARAKTAAYISDYNQAEAKAIEEANKKKEDSIKKLADAEEKLAETEKKLQETLYGTENHKNKLDYLYNYATNLDRITKSAEKAKEALSDLQEGDDPQKLLQDFLGAAHAEVVTRTAENEVIAQSIDNYKAVLDTKLGEAIAKINESGDRQISTNISDYYTQIGDRLNVNFSALNAAQLPDEISDYIETTIEEINKLSDQMESNEDSVKKKEKEFLDFKKKLRDDYLKVEDEVVKTLKEKYDEEIKSTEEKYKSIEEADNEYLDALEKAIKKQRELRDSANQYDDLAKKESQLALMQRDTSGARRGDALKLEEDIEKDREKLLDDSVDKMIESMKEMYELLKETREAEIEYQKAVLDNAALVQEANAIIEGWNSADDAVAWFYENTANLSEMSVARLEQETESWRDLYDAKQVYMEASLVDFNQALSYTADEVQKIVEATSQTLTEEADRSLSEITTSVTKAIKDAEKALEEAIRSLQEAQQAASVYGLGNTLNGNSTFSNGKTVDDFISEKSNYTITTSNVARDAASYQGKIVQIGNDVYSFDKLANFLGKNYSDDDVDTLTYALGMREKNDLRFATIGNYFKGKQNRYAGGGIVDYTGPAWVDGTFDKPEAFLSPEDTERIGKAAQLLSMSPLLNSNSAGNVTTTNVGDTSIEININIENISDDYSVDQMIDRVKQDIVDAYNPIGSSVILRNR